MTIHVLLASVLLLITQFFEDDTMKEDIFFQELAAKLQDICRLAIEQKLETDELIRLLTPLLGLLTANVFLIRILRNKFLKVLTESFSSLPLTFSLQKIDIGYRFIVEPKTISLSIQDSIMYQTNAPTDCRTFLENFVRLYPEVTTPVIQFWILYMGIFEDIFSTFGDVLMNYCLPSKVPKGHPHPFSFKENYREYYKFDLFEQIFTILNRSVPDLRLTMNDFQQILELLGKVQNLHDEITFEDYPRYRSMSLLFLSALIGFQLRDMLSNPDDKQMVTDVLNIKEIRILQLNVKAEVKYDNLSEVSCDFFKDRKANTEVNFRYLQDVITNFKDDFCSFSRAYDALQEFYKQLNC